MPLSVRAIAVPNRLLIITSLVSVALRLFLVVLLHNSYSYAGVSLTYGDLARNLKTGHGISSTDVSKIRQEQRIQNRLIDLQEFPLVSNAPRAPTMTRLPGYSVLLAATQFVFGQDRYIYIQVLQALLDGILGTFLIFSLTTSMFGKSHGILAAFLYGVSPVSRVTVYALPDAWISLFVLAILVAAAKWVTDGRFRWLFATAFLLGLCAYLRQEVSFLLVAALSAAIFISGHKLRATKFFLVCTITLTACLSPLLIRNQKVFDTNRTSSVQVGGLLWEGIGEYPNHLGATASDTALYLYQASRGYTPLSPEADRFILGEVATYIRNEPGEFFTGLCKRFLRVCLLQGGKWETGVASSGGYFIGLPLLVYRISLFLLFLIGIFLSRGVSKLTVLPITAAAGLILPHCFILLEPRHIVVASGPLFIFASFSIVHFWGARSRSRHNR